MIEELGVLLDDFPGAANQTRCFLHILNLVVKSIIKQFDLPKAVSNAPAAPLDEASMELLELAGDLILEEKQSRDEGEDDEDDDNEEGWVDERKSMPEWEREELDESVQPVRLLLTKVSLALNIVVYSHRDQSTQLRKTAFAIKNSTTIILPRWYEIVKDFKLNERIMPRDVATRWNSTYDMLVFAVEYRKALDLITSERDMKLRSYEMTQEEWEIATQLCEVLKVRKFF
jgi:hypothetical protein